MQNERLTAKEAMELMVELNRYPVGSIYSMTRNDKYAISFYYEGLDGKKKRKTCTGESKDMLLTLRTTFLTCEYTVNKAVDGYLAFHKQGVKIPEIRKRKVATVC